MMLIYIQEKPSILGFTEAVHQPFLTERDKNTWGGEGIRNRISKLQGAVQDQQEGTSPPERMQAGSASTGGATREGGRTYSRLCDPRNVLSDIDLEQMGEFVHQIKAAEAAARCKDYSKLLSFGYRNLGETADVPRIMGRNGRLPWASPYFKKHLGYIKSSTFVQLPPAHMILHGLVSGLWTLALGKEPGWEHKDKRDCPFIFSKEAIKQFQVQPFHFPLAVRRDLHCKSAMMSAGICVLAAKC
jgi:hypothetical protein